MCRSTTYAFTAGALTLYLNFRCFFVQAFRNPSILSKISGRPCPLKMQTLQGLAVYSDITDANNKRLTVFDCSEISPRAWLEGRTDGAYTVLRCERRPQDGSWLVWGQEFHVDRLSRSFSTFCHSNGENVPRSDLIMAEATSQKAIRVLLEKVAQIGNDQQACMLTIHWSSWSHLCPTMNPPKAIDVAAHLVPVSGTYATEPVRAALALCASSSHRELPSRFPFPQAKLSSWCRERRQLEAKFKGDGIGEVILCERVSNGSGTESVRLLEGITSNLFVLYSDGVLRTAPDDCVLNGFARSMVVKYAQRLGVQCQLQAPLLGEAGMWDQVFLTSSVRLVVPVCTLLMTSEESDACNSIIWSTKGSQSETSRDSLLLQRLRCVMMETMQ